MLKISVIESPNERRLILEGKLIAAWVIELRTAFEKARANLQNREVVIELKNLAAISEEGENVLLELLNERVTFRGSGVFAKEVLRQLARRMRNNSQETSR
ncbi:MAG TPA: hypothetical protein VLR92_02870 [Blastocatellia bacterium]|nr:hypothetical protein [Blastocatellia bacterium]